MKRAWKGHENYQQRPHSFPESTPLEHEHSISRNILSQSWVSSDHNLWQAVSRRCYPNPKKHGLFFQAEFVEMDLPPICCYSALPCQSEEPYNGIFLMEVPVDRKPDLTRDKDPSSSHSEAGPSVHLPGRHFTLCPSHWAVLAVLYQ